MKRILITEDDQFMANVCRHQFEEAGYQVAVAHDGHEAVAQLVSHPPDVVMLDLMLPEIDGLGVLRFLRSREDLRELPVIVVSNSDYFSGVVQSATCLPLLTSHTRTFPIIVPAATNLLSGLNATDKTGG